MRLIAARVKSRYPPGHFDWRGTTLKRFFSAALLAGVLIAAIGATVASANHSWGGYHWARTANPFTVRLGDNVSGPWDAMLVTAANDWTQSTVLDTPVVAGQAKPRSCRPTSGRVEVCSANYGNTGWLGIAQIWITGGTHITQGTVKNNDYYFGNSTYAYNNTAEMQHVICQEIGHTFGLDHQDESGISLNTCMDYYHNTSGADTKSTHPNAHDYQELGIIYGHLDSTTTVGSTAGFLPDAVPSFAAATRQNDSTYVDDLGGGRKLVTYVIWTRKG
ncbi:MAG: hypothetical protein QOH73_912 [Gaiellaceae bacterium]|jgi:hypothetical protein|nr:hypothetical protein [Gaiellaceae bacterium]